MDERSLRREMRRRKMTRFQMKVLLETNRVPKGQTITYKELARKVGKPRAYRAVGSVMRMNPFAPDVPCHRVVKSDGTLGNYSAGGTKRKMQMLKSEHAI